MKELRARSSCAGEIGRRTEFWRTLSWHLGDSWADVLCSWVDGQPDSEEAEAAVGACLVLALGEGPLYVHSTDDVKTALAELCPGVDDALMAEPRAPKRGMGSPMGRG